MVGSKAWLRTFVCTLFSLLFVCTLAACATSGAAVPTTTPTAPDAPKLQIYPAPHAVLLNQTGQSDGVVYLTVSQLELPVDVWYAYNCNASGTFVIAAFYNGSLRFTHSLQGIDYQSFKRLQPGNYSFQVNAVGCGWRIIAIQPQRT